MTGERRRFLPDVEGLMNGIIAAHNDLYHGGEPCPDDDDFECQARVRASTCTCDTINEPGFPHRPWCGLNHKHPGPDCVGLCEPAEGT